MRHSTSTKIKNVGWLLLERGVGVLIAFFVMTMVARHLGPEGFGSFAYLFGLSALFFPIAQLGLQSILMRDLGRSSENHGVTLGSALALQSMGAVLAYALALGFVVLFGGPKQVSVSLMAIAGLQLLVSPSEVFNNWFKAQERMVWVVLPRIAVALVIAAVTLFLVRQEAPLAAFVTLRGVEYIALALAALAAYAISTGSAKRFLVDRGRSIELLRNGWPLALSAVAVAIYLRVDQVMLGQMSSAPELGFYSVAVRVADVAMIVPVALRTSLFASIVRAFGRGEDELTRYEQYVYDAMVIASIATMAGLAVATLILFVRVFGVAYEPGVPMVLILLLSLPWVGLGLVRGAVLVARGWLWSPLTTTSIGAIANIALNWVLIPHFGGIGAAWATVVSYWLATHGACFLFPHLRQSGHRMTRSLVLTRSVPRLYRKFYPTGGEN